MPNLASSGGFPAPSLPHRLVVTGGYRGAFHKLPCLPRPGGGRTRTSLRTPHLPRSVDSTPLRIQVGGIRAGPYHTAVRWLVALRATYDIALLPFYLRYRYRCIWEPDVTALFALFEW